MPRPPAIPRRSTPLSSLALVALAWFVVTGSAVHAEGITAVLEREVIPLGDTAQLSVAIEGGNAELPTIPDVPGLQFVRVSTSQQMQISGATRTVVLQIGYAVSAARLGNYTIGPVTARIGGKTYSAEPLKLRVVAANDPAAARKDGLDKAAFLEVQLPRREVYVGETFVAEAHLYAIGGQVEQAPQFRADGFTGGKMQNLRSESNIRTNDRIYGRVRYLQPLTAARAGDLEIEAGKCVLSLPLARRPGFTDAFDELFGGREVRRLNLNAPAAAIRVLPLPAEGQPPGFNGAVGDFRVSLTASPTNLQAGDPVTIRLEITGRGNFDALTLPEQPAWKGFRVYPPNATFEAKDNLEITGTKRFEQVLTPESSDLSELPSFQFSFFDPDRRAYRTVRTPAVPLRVAPGASTPNLPTTAAAATDPTAAKPNLAPLKPHLGLVTAAPVPWLNQPWFLALNLVPPVTWFGARLWRRFRERRDADSAARRREQLLRRVHEGLRTLESLARAGDTDAFHAALFRVLQDAVAARTNQPPTSITEGILDTTLAAQGVPAPTIAALHGLFQACNQARYARQATAGDLQLLAQETAAATRDLARSAPVTGS